MITFARCSSAKFLHAKRHPSVLLKVDIAKAFDTLNWTFLIELLLHLGFSRHWTNWISVILSTASTKILLNGEPARRICHGRGLRQGDPLSPMLFVLTMEVLNAIIIQADQCNLFQSLRPDRIRFRVSLYADNLVIFLSLHRKDLKLIYAILEAFARASGLRTNVDKCQFTPIRCTEDQINQVSSWFPTQLVHFPCKYLGIPLSIYQLRHSEL